MKELGTFLICAGGLLGFIFAYVSICAWIALYIFDDDEMMGPVILIGLPVVLMAAGLVLYFLV